MEKDIKDYRQKELKDFVLGNILLILLESGLIDNIVQPLGDNNVWRAVAELFDSSVIATIVYIFVFVFDSIIPSKIKYRIIWPLSGLPGNKVFMDIRENNKDERFTKQLAVETYSNLYQLIDAERDKNKCARIQNEFWYKLYQKYEKEAQVYTSQRDFLLCRDMTSMMLWIFIGAVLVFCYLSGEMSYSLFIVLAAEFFIMWIAARVKGKSFVYNVIAKDLAMTKEGDE